MRRLTTWTVVFICLLGLPSAAPPTGRTVVPSEAIAPGIVGEWLVLYAAGVAPGAARAAVAAAGGRIVRENVAVGLATVRVDGHGDTFLRLARRDPALVGVTPNVPHGRVPGAARGLTDAARETEPGDDRRGETGGKPQVGSDPLATLQWDMRAIGATADDAHATQAGDNRVLVGVIDSGIDGSHPDIAPNFDRALSRNFVTDIPELDGACTYPSCVDPPDEDGNGHGTHVAGTIAAARNDLGIAGVAPNVTLVNLRAGQDSGLFLTQPTVDALTYAGDNGINVVNMSYYIDPWLYNCPANPADSLEAQQAQRTTLEATQRALDYARARGVVLIAAAGNEHTDLANVAVDTTSPNFPGGAAYRRQIDASCRNMPSEGEGVLAVTSTGPSGRKAYYSDYGLGHADIAAPGGDSLDGVGTPGYGAGRNRILSTYPKALLLKSGEIDAAGQVTARGQTSVVRDCRGEVCAYYRYLEGTSMASPHVAGVAALIVSQYGTESRLNTGKLRLPPARVERILLTTATKQGCPAQNPFTYPGLSGSSSAAYTARCEVAADGTNSFFGAGIVDAKRAVGR